MRMAPCAKSVGPPMWTLIESHCPGIGNDESACNRRAAGRRPIGDKRPESARHADWRPGYKTGQGIEPDLLAQFELLEEVLSAAGVVVWPMVEFEADDALAAAAATAGRDARVERDSGLPCAGRRRGRTAIPVYQAGEQSRRLLFSPSSSISNPSRRTGASGT